MSKILQKAIKHRFLLLVLLLALPSIFPLFHKGFFAMHDNQQVVRLFELDRALAAGQFPARWVSNLGFGYGYPLFIFYPPFIYYLGEIFHLLLGVNFIVSVKLVFAFAFFGAAVSMYLWAKHHIGKVPSVIAAAFYTYAPYHAVDAYVRGALAELTAFVWLPAILWSTDRLILKQDNKQVIWLGILLSLLMTTHNLIFLPFLPLFLMYSGFLILKSKKRPKLIKQFILANLFGLGLSAFFWLPALYEKKYTLVDSILLKELASFKLHFVYPSQLWNSLWGYGGSTAGLLDGLSFKIGKLHVVLSLITPLLWIIIFLKKRSEKISKYLILSVIIFTLLLLSAFLTTQYSQPIWETFTPLQYLQFPWRFLTFTALFSSFLAGSFILAVQKITKNEKLTITVSLIILVLLFFPNLKLFQPQNYLEVNDSYYTSDEFIKWKISKTSFEFIPNEVKTVTEFNPSEGKEITQVAINRDQISREPFRVLSGEGELKTKRNVPGILIFDTDSDEQLTIQINTFDYPDWQVTIDNEQVQHNSQNDLKLITFNIPKGKHTTNVSFRNTPTRNLANAITLATFIALLLMNKRIRKKLKSVIKQ